MYIHNIRFIKCCVIIILRYVIKYSTYCPESRFTFILHSYIHWYSTHLFIFSCTFRLCYKACMYLCMYVYWSRLAIAANLLAEKTPINHLYLAQHKPHMDLGTVVATYIFVYEFSFYATNNKNNHGIVYLFISMYVQLYKLHWYTRSSNGFVSKYLPCELPPSYTTTRHCKKKSCYFICLFVWLVTWKLGQTAERGLTFTYIHF